MPSYLSFLILGLLILANPIKCCMNEGTKDEEGVTSSSASTHTTHDSPESVAKELEEEVVPSSYETIIKRMNLKPHTRYLRLDLSLPAKPKVLAEIIYYNFVEGHFYGHNAIIERAASDNLRRESRFNGRILYHLMADEEILNFIGVNYCFVIIKEAIKTFRTFRSNSNHRKVTDMFESVGSDLADFLEFILNEMAPKYPIARDDPRYDLEAHCMLEYDTLIAVTSFIDVSVLNIFNEVDLLKVIVRRYTAIWPASITQNIINDAVSLGNTCLFREIFGFLVKRVPEYFVHSDQVVRYNTSIKCFRDNIRGTMNMMAPIFRAMMLIDSDISIRTYLKTYHDQLIKPSYDIYFSTHAVKALDYLVRDSKFAIINSFKMRERKRHLLENILLTFYEITVGNVYNIIRFVLSHELLALYEVLLQHFGGLLDPSQKKELIEMIVTRKEVENAISAAAISMGYLEIEDFDSFLVELNPENSHFYSKLKRKGHDKTFKRLMKRFKFIEGIHKLLENCPIKKKTDIFYSVRVPWEYPLGIFEEEEVKYETDPIPFYYAQAVLIKYFDISVSGVSIFESTMNESAVWSEMIDFINFMIEKQSKMVYGRQEVELFGFIDSTNY